MRTVPFQPLDPALYREIVRRALAEDLGWGDVTTEATVSADLRARGVILAKSPCVIAGLDVAAEAFSQLDPGSSFERRRADGDTCQPGDVVAELRGGAGPMLTAERTALNFLQRLCGVATQTQRYVAAVQPHPVQVWDTRKTTPGWRLLEKTAVKHGGGTNHRMGLYDHAMVKDNHLAANSDLPSLQAAIHKLRTERPGTRVQLEADTLDQVAGFLTLDGVDMLLLDNMGADKLRQAVEMNGGRLWLEASGGITLDTIRDIAATGVNAISVGALSQYGLTVGNTADSALLVPLT